MSNIKLGDWMVKIWGVKVKVEDFEPIGSNKEWWMDNDMGQWYDRAMFGMIKMKREVV